jgi:hypothetical protein
MARYFNFFPKTLYSANTDIVALDAVTNIISRLSFENGLKENSSIYYEYDVQDSDTPEIIASKFYDNPERHWIVLLFNDIVDPQYDWPLPYKSFIEFVDNKYSANGAANTTVQTGLAWAMSTNNTHSYYKKITRTNFDGTTIVETIEVDSNTYVNVASTTETFTLQNGTTITETVTKEKKTYYEYEMEKNESKRSIKLIKQDFVPAVEKEFKRLLRR